MGLKEKAIGAYEEEKELIKESNIKEAETFAENALISLREILGDECGNIKIVVKRPGSTSFRVDGISFRVTSSQGYSDISVIKKCPICETESTFRVSNLKDIGREVGGRFAGGGGVQGDVADEPVVYEKNGKII